MEEILKITNVSKSFGKVKAVDNISFKVTSSIMIYSPANVSMVLVNLQLYR